MCLFVNFIATFYNYDTITLAENIIIIILANLCFAKQLIMRMLVFNLKRIPSVVDKHSVCAFILTHFQYY